MRRVVLFLAVVGECIGCSGSRVQGAGGSASDYEIVSEQEGNASNLRTKNIEVATSFTKEEKLRRIAEEIKSENADQDALTIGFYENAPGQNGKQDDPPLTGAAIVVNNEEAAEQFGEAVNRELGVPPLTDADIERMPNEDDGISVIPFAQMEQELDRDMQEEMEQERPRFPKPPKP